MSIKSRNITKVEHRISDDQRRQKNAHKGTVIWFTGLSASGKTTLATTLEQRLFELGRQVYVLDGDNVRHGLCSDLGFSAEDRAENIRRIGEMNATSLWVASIRPLKQAFHHLFLLMQYFE